MKIEKRIYKVVCRGKRFSLFLNVSNGIKCRQKVLIERKREIPIRVIRIHS